MKYWLWIGVLLAGTAWGAEGPYKVEITTNSPTCLSERTNADGVSYRCTEFKDNPPSVRLLTPSDTDYILDMAEALNMAHEHRTQTFKYDSGPKPLWPQPHCDPPSVEINGIGCMTPN